MYEIVTTHQLDPARDSQYGDWHQSAFAEGAFTAPAAESAILGEPNGLARLYSGESWGYREIGTDSVTIVYSVQERAETLS